MSSKCEGCRGASERFDFAMAFQPIVDVEIGKVFAYEALVRGPQGQPANTIIETVTPDNLYAFDQQCRIAAIEGAVAAGILDTDARLSINFLPNAVYSPLACIQLTLKTAAETGFPTDRLIFEFTENEEMADTGHVKAIVQCYNEMGFGTAIDDFGAGYAGLSMLANLETDYLKLDMALIRNIQERPRSRLIVEGMVELANKLGVTAIVEGIETDEEWRALRAMGLRYFQGFLFAKPAFRSLPEIVVPGPPLEI